jgi:integrase/recombinase XerC/integrase/recombinase XerD
MATDNTVTLIGNLTDNPELRFTTNGVAVANFRLAVTPRIRQGDTWTDGETSFFRVNWWRQLAEHVTETLSKGARAIVIGRLRMRSWETDQGERRSIVEIEADEVAPSPKFATATIQLERLFGRHDLPLRERTLWRLLYETAARANELLALDVQDLDLANRRARVHSKGGALEWVFWQTGSAQLLPRLLAGRTHGPVFPGDRRPTRAVAGLDLDPASGRTRLCYRRAAELSRVRTGWTLHQLRHSALTHAAEDGTNLPLLLARSRHASVRSLERYARPPGP